MNRVAFPKIMLLCTVSTVHVVRFYLFFSFVFFSPRSEAACTYRMKEGKTTTRSKALF